VKRLKQDLAALAEGLNNKEIPSLPFPNIETLVPKAQKEGMLLEADELFAIGLGQNLTRSSSFFCARPSVRRRLELQECTDRKRKGRVAPEILQIRVIAKPGTCF
jgi:hypothetical protein